MIDIVEARALDAVTPYGYMPTKWVGYLMIILFGLSTRKSEPRLSPAEKLLTIICSPVVHFVQAVRYRMWFLLITAVFAGILETAGWAGRLWSSYDVLQDPAFTMQ